MAKLFDFVLAAFGPVTIHESRARILIKHLRCLTSDPAATRHYEMMSGGFVWSDEQPPKDYRDSRNGYVFRLLLGYRASLTLGRPREELRPTWDAVLNGCPQWPGFLPERRNSELAEQLERFSKRSLRQLEALDRALSKRGSDELP